MPIINGDFHDGLSGWLVLNPDGGAVRTAVDGPVRFNRLDQDTYGEAIQQDIDTPVGISRAIELELGERGGGVEDHSFKFELIDGDGNIIFTEDGGYQIVVEWAARRRLSGHQSGHLSATSNPGAFADCTTHVRDE